LYGKRTDSKCSLGKIKKFFNKILQPKQIITMGGQNRIVVDYGDYEGLVLLGAINTKSGVEIDRAELEKLEGFEIVKKYDGIIDFKTLKEKISNDAEGFVIRFKDGFRMKIKGEEYVRLHRILTQFSNIDIWEYLKEKKDLSLLLEKVPDEYDKWVKGVIKELEDEYNNILNYSLELYQEIKNKLGENMDKKEFALYVNENVPLLHKPILFLLHNNNYVKIFDYIFKQIRPVHSKPFWKKDEIES
jgi:hypothetical protein